MSVTTHVAYTLDPSASVHPETLGQAPHHGRLKGRRIIVVGAGQRKVVDAEPPIGNGRAMAALFARGVKMQPTAAFAETRKLWATPCADAATGIDAVALKRHGKTNHAYVQAVRAV